jgi:pimeloyl-ACP methyl ester carboxylesterase
MNNIPNLLLLPGLLCDGRLWQQQIFELSDYAHCIVADLSGENSISAMAESAIAQIPAGPFALAGLSMGGYVALEIMRLVPKRVIALALLDTSARPDSAEATKNRRKAMADAQSDFAAVVAALIPKLIHPKKMDSPALLGVITAMANTLGKETFINQQQAIIERVDSRADLANIHCHTLILCGRDDAVTPVEIHQEMHAAIANSELVIIEDCGHLSTLEKAAQVTGALTQWLQKI